MKNILSVLLGAMRRDLRAGRAGHDDRLRANQFNEPRNKLTPWLILIG